MLFHPDLKSHELVKLSRNPDPDNPGILFIRKDPGAGDR
jgi:hypothetical protein